MGYRSPIALITDFGLRDPFVGIMKGVILGINPSASIVDVCHMLDPGDIRSASFALAAAFPYFPAGAIFVAVVDPGVGTARKPIAAEVDGRFIVCPDNGILSWVIHRYPLSKAVELTNREFFLPEVSDTFHGRDVFAPVAAHLSKGVSLESLGPVMDEVTAFAVPEVEISDRSMQGEVVYIDRFGNLLTNIFRDKFEAWKRKLRNGSVKIHLGSIEIPDVSRTYGDVPPGHGVAVFGSTGLLEIAVNGGSAATSYGASVGSHILIYQLPS